MPSTPSKIDFDAEDKYMDIRKQIEEIDYEFNKFMEIEKPSKLEYLNSLKRYHEVIVNKLNEEPGILEDYLKENNNYERLVEHIKTYYNTFFNADKSLKSSLKSFDTSNIFDGELDSSEYPKNETNHGDYSDSNFEEAVKSEFEQAPTNKFIECSCCNSFTGILVECIYCKRKFHNNCHIPALGKNMDIDEWKCTICQDITKYSKVLTQEDLTSGIPGDLAKRKVMERLLMEFYCQTITVEKFRMSSLKGMNCLDYHNIHETFDLSLNVMKERLKSGMYYSSLVHFLSDLRLMFSNAILYHIPSHPYYYSAVSLQQHLETLITKWIPTYGLNEKSL